MDMADVKVTLLSFLIVGLMASIFILGGKIVFNTFPVEGAKDFFNAI